MLIKQFCHLIPSLLHHKYSHTNFICLINVSYFKAVAKVVSCMWPTIIGWMTHKTEIFPMNVCMFNVQGKQQYWIISQYSDGRFEEKTLFSVFQLSLNAEESIFLCSDKSGIYHMMFISCLWVSIKWEWFIIQSAFKKLPNYRLSMAFCSLPSFSSPLGTWRVPRMTSLDAKLSL